MDKTDFEFPVSQLFTLGEPTVDALDVSNWLDYATQYQLTDTHIPDLIRLLGFRPEPKDEEWDDVETWAVLHAWRALGQLRAVEAIDPLIAMFKYQDTWQEWIIEEIPMTIGLIGAAALPSVKKALAETATDYEQGGGFSLCIDEIVKQNPETIPASTSIITDQLHYAATNDPMINGFLISSLVSYKNPETLPIIETAFATDNVDESIVGDFDDIQVAFGLKEPDPNKKRRYPHPLLQSLFEPSPSIQTFSSSSIRKAEKKEKNKRKQAKKSRKQNRKRK